jgi:ATP-dependent DNA helicase RecQ
MDQNTYYGVLAKAPAYKLRQVMNYLMLNEFLTVTNDEYAVVKLTGKSKSILTDGESIVMKMAKEHTVKVKEEKKSKKSRMPAVSGTALSEIEKALFEALRTLRMEIAKEEKVPPYIVFSDKTLVHMCMMKPRTKKEMLSVSGVGEFKYEKYGERFLVCVKEAGVIRQSESRQTYEKTNF